MNVYQRDYLNESNLILPFYYNGKMKDFENYMKANANTNNNDNIQKETIWQKDSRRTYRYLAAHIDSLIDNENPDSICYSYHLSSSYRLGNEWPSSQDMVHMESRIMRGYDNENFSFILANIRMMIFRTGIGFLIFNIKHEAEESLSSIEDKSFSLTRFYTKEIAGTAKENELFFSYKSKDFENDEEKNINFSLSQIVNQVLQISKTEKDKVKLFPTSNKKECNIFHRIIIEKPLDEEQLNANLYILRRAFHSSFYKNKEDACPNQCTDFIYQTQHNNYFSFCQRGLACLYYNTEDRDIFFQHFTNNVRYDYFFIYLFLLHERQALFLYNSLICSKKYRNLNSMKKTLIDFRINYIYKVISDEASYQNYYNLLYEAFGLDELNEDIQDMIDRASEHQTNTHESSTNTALAILALFGIFSAFESSFAIIDRLNSDIPLTLVHIILAGIIIIVVILSLIVFIKKRK